MKELNGGILQNLSLLTFSNSRSLRDCANSPSSISRKWRRASKCLSTLKSTKK